MNINASVRWLGVLAAFASGACSDRLTSPGPESLPVQLVVVSGQDQRGIPGSQLPEPLVVQVTDGAGVPVAGYPVNFVVTSGGGSTFAGVGMTNSAGMAREWWTLGPELGANTLEARGVDSSTGDKLLFGTFRAEATTGPPVESVSVTPQATTVTTGQTVQLTATPRDASGNALTGRTITWSSSNTNVARVTTNGLVTGVAAGVATIRASSEGRTGSATVTVIPDLSGLRVGTR